MKKLLLISLILLGFSLSTKASHLMGADISYQYLYSDATNDYYQVTLTLYRDCSGVSVGAAQTITMNSGSGCGSTFTVSLPIVGTGTEVSPLCPTQLSNSTCNGGTIMGVEQYVFQDIVAFPDKCNDWNISFYQCCRNDGGAGPPPHNLVTPASWDLYVEAELNNTGSLNNNSPQFTSLPVPYICTNQPFTYNHGAFDPDGDSLVYTMIPAQDGPYPGTNLAYVAPATPTQPIVGANNVFDTRTGSIVVNPDGSDELAVMAVRVDEYRNGVLIGTTMRDLQVVIQSCSNVQPQDGGINPGFDVVTGDGAIVDSNSIEVCPNGYVEFEVVYSDPNAGDVITLMTNIATVIPGATFSQSGTNPATGVFTWTPTTADVGFHNFTITVQDDGCPILGSQVFAFDIDVLTRTFTEPDQSYCTSGGPISISANGGSVFTWLTLSGDGLGCTSCATTTGAPTTSGTYEVTSDLSGTCKNKDTITITKVPDIALTPSSDPTICKYGSAPISVGASPAGEGPFTYSWTGDSLTNNGIFNPTASPLTTTTYPVQVISDAGCIMNTSVTVNVSGVAPNVRAYASDDSLCAGESVNLTSAVFPDVCETTTTPCSGSNQTLELGFGTTATSTYGPFYHSASGYSNKRQIMFRASELHALGFTTGGRINSLDLNVAVDGGMAGAMTGLQVSMGCTDETQFTNTSYLTGLSVVRNAAGYTPAAGWNTITFDNPYMWDGQSNLVVEFCTNDIHSGTSSTVYYTSTGATFYSIIYNQVLGTGACSSGTGFRTYYRPNIRFDVCEAISAGITYSWSPSGGTGSTATETPGATTTYTLTATDGSCDGNSDVTVLVGQNFNLATTADNTICYGGSFNVSTTPSVGGSYTYSWTPTLFNSTPTAASTSVSPPATMMYYTSVSNGSCRKNDSVEITVAGLPFTALLDGDSLCAGDQVQLDMTTDPVVCGIDFAGCQGAPTTNTLGIATTSTYSYGPFYRSSLYTDSRYEYIFTAAELTAAGFTPGTVSEIGLNVITKNTVLPFSNVMIRMGCTSLNAYPGSGYNYIATDVVYGPYDWTSSTGWNNFVFDNGFSWDGVSNLVVQFCYDNLNADSYDYFEYSSLTPNYQTIGGYATSGTGCSLSPIVRYFYRPNFEITICDPPSVPGGSTFSWTPAATVTSPTNSSTSAAPVVNTTYTLALDDGTCISTSDVNVGVSPLVNTTMNGTTSICYGDNTNLSVTPSGSSGYVYSWSPVQTVSSTTTAATTASPTSTTMYYVDINAGFCDVRDSIEVSVAGIPTNVVASDDTICPNTTISLDVTTLPTSCGVTYDACATSSTGSNIGTSIGNTYSYGPMYYQSYGSRMEYIYTAAELTAAGLTAGAIKEINFTVGTKNTGDPYSNLTVTMGCTSMDEYPIAGYDWEATDVVYGPSSSFSTVAGANTLVLDNGFNWDGTSNIAVQFCQDNVPGASYDYFNYESTGSFRTLRYYASGLGGCNASPAWRNNYRPVFSFTVCDPPALSGGSSFTWTGENVSNTSIQSPTATPTQSGTYSVTVVDPAAPACPSVANKNIIIDSLVYVAATADRTLACNGEVVNMVATPTGSPLPASYSSCGMNGSGCANGSSTGQVGAGTSTSYSYGPFYSNTTYFDSHFQYIITAAELNSAGLGSGAFNNVSVNIPTTNFYSGSLDNVTIKMGCTGLSQYPSTGFAYLATTTVFGPSSITLNGTGWHTITLDNTFDWDGTSNVVLEFCYNNNSSVSYAYFQYGITSGYQTLRQYESSSMGMGAGTCALSTTLYRNNYRPNFQFNICTPPPVAFTYSWSPATGLSSSTSATPNYTSNGSGNTYVVTVSGGKCDVYDTVTVAPCVLANENVKLEGRQEGLYNLLSWTSTLQDVKTYEVERLSSNGSFESIGKSKVKGDKYDFIDNKPLNGENKYRLRCKMNDGSEEFSNTISINFINDNVVVYPNPSNSSSSIFISFESETDQVSIEMIDLLGQEVISTTANIQGGQSKVELDVSTMPSGTYIYKVNIEGRITIGKLVLNN